MRRCVALILLVVGSAACPQSAPPPHRCIAGSGVAIIAYLSEPAETARSVRHPENEHRARVARALVEHATWTQAPLLKSLRDLGAQQIKSLPIANAIAARVPVESIDEIRQRSDVARVALDEVLSAPHDGAATTGSPMWNLEAIGAPRLWQQGIGGAGIVVANMDTGVDVSHPDLASRWRGGTNSWFDPFDGSVTPFDPLGHGTQTMGLLVGGNASGTPVGVAPGAQWIAARVYDASGQTTTSVLHEAFQWLLDPDGDPGTDDAPRVVNASWGNRPGFCDLEFQHDIETLRTAGILVVFAAGNSGPGAPSDVSPANGPFSLGTGAVDPNEDLAEFSARGPSSCDGRVFPDLVAPGVGVRTTDLSFGGVAQYAYVTGTSFAAPHVAGAAALLLSVRPDLTPGEVEDLLRGSAKDLGGAGPDSLYGNGLLDVTAAIDNLASHQAAHIELLPVAQVQVPYRALLRLTGATAMRWTISAGELPEGIALEADALAGTPTRSGAFTFTLVAETPSPVTQEMTLTVLPPPLEGSHCSAE